MDCLYQHPEVEFDKPKLVTGYSLGEIAALTECGTVSHADAMSIPLALAEDCVNLAHDVELGILFSRQGSLSEEDVSTLCQRITYEGKGVIGISAILSPNSMLLMGQGETIRQFKKRAKTELTTAGSVRINREHWPPLHTPIVWSKAIPNRAAVLLQTLDIKLETPNPPVLSIIRSDCGTWFANSYRGAWRQSST
jgi:[acyl-carrier-protein] S-malonyltransferase